MRLVRSRALVIKTKICCVDKAFIAGATASTSEKLRDKITDHS